jgi:hypothetical protein
MSSRNGDKARFGRQRKQKIHKREALRRLRAEKPAAVPAVEAQAKV